MKFSFGKGPNVYRLSAELAGGDKPQRLIKFTNDDGAARFHIKLLSRRLGVPTDAPEAWLSYKPPPGWSRGMV